MCVKTKVCTKCGEERELCEFYNSKFGKYGKKSTCKVCEKKYNKNKQLEICSICGGKKRVSTRSENDDPICPNCNGNMNKEVCSICEKLKKVDTRSKNGDPICPNCNRYMNKEICSICKKIKTVATRDINGNSICGLCNANMKKEDCYICGKNRIVSKRIGEKAMCGVCGAKERKDICHICNKLKKIITRHNNKPTCLVCWKSIRMKTDIDFAIRERLRTRIRNSVMAKPKNTKYAKIIEFLGPCLGNLEEYHIDHIFPLSAFNLMDEIEVQIALAPENHQWLTAEENLKKGSKYNKKELEEFKKAMIEKYNLKG